MSSPEDLSRCVNRFVGLTGIGVDPETDASRMKDACCRVDMEPTLADGSGASVMVAKQDASTGADTFVGKDNDRGYIAQGRP